MPTNLLETRLTKTEDRLDRIEQLVLQQSINITKNQQQTDRLSRRIDELRQETDKLRITMQESSIRMEESNASMEESNAPMEEGFADLRKSQQQLNKQLRELSCRLGTVVEDLVAPSLGRIFFEVTDLPEGSEILINVRIKRRHPVTREIREFDAIVESDKYLLVNETKSTLKPEDIPQFLAVLTEFYTYFPEHKNKGLLIIGAMSSMHLDESLITALSKQGLLALAIGDTITTLKNPEGFEWKVF